MSHTATTSAFLGGACRWAWAPALIPLGEEAVKRLPCMTAHVLGGAFILAVLWRYRVRKSLHDCACGANDPQG